MKIRAIIGMCLILGSMACGAMAADNPKVAMDVKDTPIDQVVADLAKQAGVQIVCDSDVKANVTGQFQSIELDKLLDTITKMSGLKWQKMYLPAPTDDQQKPTLQEIKARADAVAAVSAGTLIVCDPVTGKQKVFVEQDPATPSVDPAKLGLKVLYLITKPKAEIAATGAQTASVAQFKSLEDERTQMLAKMSPEERVQALQSEMVTMMSMDPAARQDMVLAQFQARQSMDPQTQAQYRQAMRDAFSALRSKGLIPANTRGQRGGGNGNGGGGRRNRGGDGGGNGGGTPGG